MTDKYATDTPGQTFDAVLNSLDDLAKLSGKTRGDLVGEALVLLMEKYAPEVMCAPKPAAPKQQVNFRATAETKVPIDALAGHLDKSVTDVMALAVEEMAKSLPIAPRHGVEGVEEWKRSRTLTRAGGKIRVGEAHKVYQNWCIERGQEPASLTRFGLTMKNDLGVRYEENGKRGYYRDLAFADGTPGA